VDRCANDSRAAPRRDFFCQIWSSRKSAVRETPKQQKLNKNARVIIVLAEQKKMGDLLSSRKLAVREQPQFNNARALIVLAEQKTPGRLVDRCANDSRAAPRRDFLANFAAVVRWFCHLASQRCVKHPNRKSSTMHVSLLCYESKTSGRLVERCANDSRAASRLEFFWQILLPWWGQRYVKNAKVQQCTCHYCANPAKKIGDLLSIRKLAVQETAKQPQFNNAHAIRVLAEQK